MNEQWWTVNEVEMWRLFRNQGAVEQMGGLPAAEQRHLVRASVMYANDPEGVGHHLPMIYDAENEYTLSDALQSGRLAARGIYPNESVPRDIPVSDWSSMNIREADNAAALGDGYVMHLTFDATQAQTIWRGNYQPSVKIGRKVKAEDVAATDNKRIVPAIGLKLIEASPHLYCGKRGGPANLIRDVLATGSLNIGSDSVRKHLARDEEVTRRLKSKP